MKEKEVTMKHIISTITLSLVLLPALAAAFTPDEVIKEKVTTWEDKETGYHYMILENPRTYTHATMACGNRGWNLFNLKYLSYDERARFFQSPIYAALPWTTRFQGDP